MTDTNWWEKFEDWCLWAGVILSALNLSLKWGFTAATINNWLIDYLLIKLYLGQILLLLAVFAVIVRKIKAGWQLTEKKLLFFTLTSWTVIFLSSLARLPIVNLYFYGQIGLILIAAVIVREKIKNKKKWKNWLIGGINGLIGGESLLAFYQLLQQRNLFPYPFLGETNLQVAHDLARGSIFGKSLVLPYGTLAHPNILAGTTVVLLWWLWRQTSFKKWWQKVIFGLGLGTILATQSITAEVFAGGLIVSVIVKRCLVKQKLLEKIEKNCSKKLEFFGTILISVVVIVAIPLLMARAAQIFPENDSIVRRARLNQMALLMWQKNPFFGVGMNQFTANLNEFWPSNQFTQPAHNIFLLFLAENGIFGLIWLIALLKWLFLTNQENLMKDKVTQLIVLLSWIVFLSLDHYLLTNFWGLLVFLMFI